MAQANIEFALSDSDLTRLADLIAERLAAKSSPSPTANEPLLSEEETAARAGVPKHVIRDARYKRKELRGYRVGRSWKYRWSDVEKWSESQVRPSM